MVENQHSGKIRVFVYGSLKRGRELNVLMRKGGAERIGFDYIEEDAVLADMGPFPALVRGHGHNEELPIYGEVYAVDADTLAALDYAEGHPRFFRRYKTWSKVHKLRVWVYALTDKAAEVADEPILTGIWQPSAEERQFWKARGVDHGAAI